jgi:hypothetical protein
MRISCWLVLLGPRQQLLALSCCAVPGRLQANRFACEMRRRYDSFCFYFVWWFMGVRRVCYNPLFVLIVTVCGHIGIGSRSNLGRMGLHESLFKRFQCGVTAGAEECSNRLNELDADHVDCSASRYLEMRAEGAPSRGLEMHE